MSNRIHLAAWCALLAPTSVVLHELGHFVTGWLLGYPVRLHVASVSGGPELGTAAAWEVAVSAGSGPLVTAIITVGAIYAMRHRRRPQWAIALAAVAPVRFLVAMAALFASAFLAVTGGPRGSPNFDEYNFATALGVPPDIVSLGVTAFLVWSWAQVWRKLSQPRWKSLSAIVVGAAIGLAVWFQFAGPFFVAAPG